MWITCYDALRARWSLTFKSETIMERLPVRELLLILICVPWNAAALHTKPKELVFLNAERKIFARPPSLAFVPLTDANWFSISLVLIARAHIWSAQHNVCAARVFFISGGRHTCKRFFFGDNCFPIMFNYGAVLPSHYNFSPRLRSPAKMDVKVKTLFEQKHSQVSFLPSVAALTTSVS